VLQRSLGRSEHAADVDVDHSIHLLQCRVFERLRNGRAGIVHQHIQPAEGRKSFLDRSHNYTYGPVGSLGANQLTEETIPGQADTLRYQYDALSRQTGRSLGSLSETWSYDALGRQIGHGTPLGQFSTAYLGQTDQRSSRHMDGSLIHTDYQYEDNLNDRRLKAIDNEGGNGRRPSDFIYGTDAENRILTMLEPNWGSQKPHLYSYDTVDRLLADDGGMDGWRYGYDAADNRTSAVGPKTQQAIVPNALNQMQTVNGQPTQYDAAGDLLEDEARQYDWDAEHRLVRIRYKAQAGKETRFAYDGLSRRTMITEIDTAGTTETHYIWCGQVICQKRDASGQLLRAYYPEGEYGPEIGQRVAKVDADDNPTDVTTAQQANGSGAVVYAGNHLGSVSETLTPNGKVVTHSAYGPYGETQTKGRGDYRSDFRYAGMQYHAASGMYLTQFRAYDPNTGRWVSRDPIREYGGINLYAYVSGNPVKFNDPRGLDNPGMGPYNPWDPPGSGSCSSGPNEPGLQPVCPECFLSPALRLGWSAAGDATPGVAQNLAGDKNPSTPTGLSGSPMDVPRGTNAPGNVNGIEYSGHTFDEMQSDGLTPTVVQNTIEYGSASPGNTSGTTVYYDSTNNVSVVTNSSGRVITVYRGGR
jgi:RHS repeat-associated protein